MPMVATVILQSAGMVFGITIVGYLLSKVFSKDEDKTDQGGQK